MLHHVETGTGPAVVLLHAFPMDNALWTAQREALGGAGYRVIVPDLSGFGGSSVSRETPSLDVMADAVVELLDELGIERVVLGGLSMGGYVAMAVLRRAPGRISALVLADTKGTADTAEAAANRQAVATAVETAGTTAGIVDGLLSNLLGATSRESRPTVVATVRRWILAQPAAGVAWAQRAMAARPDSTSDIGAYGGPVLVLYGVEDTITTPADGAAMAKAARDGGSTTTVAEIHGAGHLSAVEDPKAVTDALLGWLKTL